METLTTCPRGHALPEDAVFCEVCWIRVSQDGEAARTAGSSRRRTTVALSVLGAGCITVGVVVAAMIASAPGDIAVPVAAAQPSVAASSIPEVPVAEAAAPVAVTLAAPLAATVPKPVEESAPADCAAAVRGGEVACTVTDGWLEFSICVPDATTFIRVGTRPDNTVKFQDGVSEIALGGPSSCAADETNATVRIFAYSPEAMWRVVGRDADDNKVWKSRVVATTP